MEMFTIFLCIVIGHVFGDLQGTEIGKGDLKARENAREDLSSYVKEAVNLDQYLQPTHAHEPAKSCSSNETETDEKPSSLVMRSPVKASSYETKKSRQKGYLKTHVADMRSLLKHSDRNISAKKDSMKFSSFPVKSAAIRHAGKDFAIKISRSFRGKRDALDAFNRMLEPAFEVLHPKPRRKKHRRKKRTEKNQIR